MNITKLAATSLLLIALGGCTTTAAKSDAAMDSDAKATSTDTTDLEKIGSINKGEIFMFANQRLMDIEQDLLIN
jgi:hypothetical protein